MPNIICPSCRKRIGNRNTAGTIRLKTKLVKTMDDGKTGVVCPECSELVTPQYENQRFKFEINAASTDKSGTTS